MNKGSKIDIFDLDLLLKGLYSIDFIEENGKKSINTKSDKNQRILSADGILCEYAYLYYISSRYNFAKDKEDTNTNVSREYLGYIVANKEMFNWLNNTTLLYMCNEALKFRLGKPALIRGSLRNTLNGFDLANENAFNTNVDFGNIFGSLGVKIEEDSKLPDLATALSKGSQFKIMANLEDTKVKTDGYAEDTVALLEEMVDDEVNYITQVVGALYESGYQGFTPDGMLNKAGTVSVVADSSITNANGKAQARYKITQVTNTQLTKFYAWLSAQFPVFSLSKYNGNMRPSYNNIKNGVIYYPHYQARNSCGLYGLDRSLDAYLTANNKSRIENAGALKTFLKDRIKNIIMEGMVSQFEDLLKKPAEESEIVTNPEVEALLKTYRKVLTTAAVVTEGKRNVVVKLKLSPGTRDDAIKMTKDFFEKALKTGKIFNQATKITYYSLDEEHNIVTITFMMDEKKYNGFPLFAFQAVEAIKRNGKPSWSNVVVGRTIDDKIFTLDLTENTTRVVPIIAGSRSGKGVMTLNFLANAFALQYPVFYLDFKSEMGYTFYKLARDRGVETFAYDGSHSSKAIPRDYDLLTGINKLPENVKKALDSCKAFDRKEFALMTSYIRGMQLLDRYLTLRAMAFEKPNPPYSVEELGGPRAVIVWDEFEKFGIQVDTYMKKNGVIDSAQDELKAVFSDMKDPEIKKTPEWKWFDDYKRWVKGVFSGLSSHEKAEWAQARVTIFLLAQSVEIDQRWGDLLGSTMGTIIRNSLKVCGRGSDSGSGSSKYGSGGVNPDWKLKLNDRYFIIQHHAGGAVSDDNSSLVKGYFLLDDLYDDNGNEASCVSQLFSNLGANAESVRQEVSINGKLNPALAFDGYMQLLADGQDVFGPTLKKSWDLASLVSNKVYGYANLNDYMYDVGNFSSNGEILEHINEYETEREGDSKSADSSNNGGRDLSSQSTMSSEDMNQSYEEDEEEQVNEDSENLGDNRDPGYAEPPKNSIFGDLFSGMHIRTDLDEPDRQVNSEASTVFGGGVAFEDEDVEVNMEGNDGAYFETASRGDFGDSTYQDEEVVEIELDEDSPDINNGDLGENSGGNSASDILFGSYQPSGSAEEDEEIDIDIDIDEPSDNIGNEGNFGIGQGIIDSVQPNHVSKQPEIENVIPHNLQNIGNTQAFDTSSLNESVTPEINGSPVREDKVPETKVNEPEVKTIFSGNEQGTNVNEPIGKSIPVRDTGATKQVMNRNFNVGNAGGVDLPPYRLHAQDRNEASYYEMLVQIGNLQRNDPNNPALPALINKVYEYDRRNGRIPANINRSSAEYQEILRAEVQANNTRLAAQNISAAQSRASIAIKKLLHRKVEAQRNKGMRWLDFSSRDVVASVNTILENEAANGCEIDYEDNDLQAKAMIVDCVLQAATKFPEVMNGMASGVLTLNPGLPAQIALRTQQLRQRQAQQENIRIQQNNQNRSNASNREGNINNRNVGANGVSGGSLGSNVNVGVNNVGVNLDNQSRQYNEMQQRLQQQRAAQQAQQQALQQQRAAQQAQQEQFSINDYESFVNFTNMSPDQMAYQARTPKDNALKVNLRNIKAQVFGLTPQNSVDVSRTRNASPFKRSTMLSRTAYGAKVYRKEAFRSLLDTIDLQLLRGNIGNFNGVNMLVMRDDTIVINNLVVDLNGVVGGITGRKLRDLVNYKELAKRYPRIAVLEIDDDLLTVFCLEYTISPQDADALFNKIFQLFPSLNTFRVGQYEMTRNEIMLKAQDRRIAEKQAKIAEKARRQRSRSAFDAEMLSMTNARPSEDSSLSGNNDYYNSSLMSPSEVKMRAKNITKGVAGFGLAAAAFTLGALATGFSAGRNLFRRKG